MPKKVEPSLKLMRHMLASIDLSDIEEKDLTEAERVAYTSSIFAVFPIIEKDIKKFLHTQLMFASNETTDWNQTMFARGTFNGMDLLLEYWRKAAYEYESRAKEDKDFDKNNPLPEL